MRCSSTCPEEVLKCQRYRRVRVGLEVLVLLSDPRDLVDLSRLRDLVRPRRLLRRLGLEHLLLLLHQPGLPDQFVPSRQLRLPVRSDLPDLERRLRRLGLRDPPGLVRRPRLRDLPGLLRRT
jgi:hypothetical protein